MPRDVIVPDPRWYCLALEGGAEERTRNRIASRRPEWPIWLPMCEEQLRRRARNVPCIEPLYPGYGFLHLDHPRRAMDALQGIDGVLGLVEIAGAFGWLSDERVAALKRVADREPGYPDGVIRFKRALQLLFLRGEQVKVMDRAHPACGLVGEIMAVRSAQRVEIMLGSLRSTIAADKLERV